MLLLELLCDKEQPGSALCVRAVNLGTVLEHVALVFLFALAAMAVNAGFDTAETGGKKQLLTPNLLLGRPLLVSAAQLCLTAVCLCI